MRIKSLLMSIFIVCSADSGLTKIFFEHANHIFYSKECLVFMADKEDGFQAVCAPEAECVITEGEVPPSNEEFQKEQKQ